jgi:CheY-like chemotaxis protein
MSQASKTARVLLIQRSADSAVAPGAPGVLGVPAVLGDNVEVFSVESFEEARGLLSKGAFDYVVATPESLRAGDQDRIARASVECHDSVTQGVGIVDASGGFVWANPRLVAFPDEVRSFVSRECRAAIEFASASPAMEQGSRLSGRHATYRGAGDAEFELTATPIIDAEGAVTQVVAVVWDMTRARLREQQLAAIDHAGRELLTLDCEQISRLETQERLSLLEQKIIRYLRELMHFDHFSIHIFDKKTNKLNIVLSSGLPEMVENIDLFALPEGNGIAGYVAYHGRSYICPDVTRDGRYFNCLEEARSSLTVPLKLNEEVIGVLNVESNELAAFDEDNRRLAEIFGRDIATALHILDLLVTERHTTRGRLGSDVLAEITQPVNDILTDVENLVEDYIGHDDLRHRLGKITENAVAIRETIKDVTAPKRGIIGKASGAAHKGDPILSGKRILIADDEGMIRDTVRDVLKRYGCDVLTADDGLKALALVEENAAFDLVLSDIRMPGADGYDVYAAAKEKNPDTPVILMTGFGYDPNHSIVRARREGLAAVLFKPFKVDQLLGEIRSAIRSGAGKGGSGERDSGE